MELPEDQQRALGERHQVAVARLRDALGLELARFVTGEVEKRLRARPNFFGRMKPAIVASLRGRVDSEPLALVASLAKPITDLRVYYGAEARSADEEDRGFAKTVGEAADGLARRLLGELAFPGDDKPDRADVTSVDLDAEYQVRFEPSPALLWAWRSVRELDGVRNRLADGAAAGFELRWHLPEHAAPR